MNRFFSAFYKTALKPTDARDFFMTFRVSVLAIAALALFTPAFVSAATGTFQGFAFKDGQPWNGPSFSVNYTGPSGTVDAPITTPFTYSGVPTGTYSINGVSNIPAGVTFDYVSPYSQNLSDGGTATFNFYFKSIPLTGTIQVIATKDGQPWNGASFSVSYMDPSGTQHTSPITTPYSYSGVPTGTYTINGVSNLPAGVSYSGVTPSATQTLSSGGTITSQFNFTSGGGAAAFSKYYRRGADSRGNLDCPSGWNQIDSWGTDEGDSADGGGGMHTGLACSSSAYKAAFSKYYRTNDPNVIPPCPSGWAQVDSWAVQEGDRNDGGGGWHGGVACASNNYTGAISKYIHERAGGDPAASWWGSADSCPGGTQVDSWTVYEGDSGDGGGGTHYGRACAYNNASYTKVFSKYYRADATPPCPSGWNPIDAWGSWEEDPADGGGGVHNGVACASTASPPSPPPPPPAIGTVRVIATKDGQPWNSPSFSVNYSASGNPSTATIAPPQAFGVVPAGFFAINGVIPPAGVTFAGASPMSFSLTNGSIVTVTFNFVTKAVSSGTIIIKATKDGVDWDSPPFTVSGTAPSGSVTETVDPPQTFSNQAIGAYSITSVIPPSVSPAVTFSNVTPSASQTLTANGTITFTINFVTTVVPPQTGTIQIRATKDGASWSGSLVFDDSTPGGFFSNVSWTAPSDTPNLQTGTYNFVYKSGGPPGTTLSNITPSATQTLSAGGTITFVFNFVTTPSPTGTIQINAFKDGVLWNTSFTENYTHIYPDGSSWTGNVTLNPQQTLFNVPTGTYTVNTVTPPSGVTLQSVNGSSLPYSQTLTQGNTITFNYYFVTTVVATPTLVVVPSSATVDVGGTHQFGAIYDPDGPTGPLPPVNVTVSAIWSSSDNSIASVDALGKATGLQGSFAPVQIIARYSGLTASADLTVTASVPTFVISPHSASVAIGNTQQFTAVYDPDGSGPKPPQDVTATAVWTSLDAAKVTTAGGLATRIGHGLTLISASYLGLSDSAMVLDPATFRIVPSSAALRFGTTVQLSALYDPDGLSGAQPEQDVTASSNWSSNRPSIAAVDNALLKGLVTAGSTAGFATISASYTGLIANAGITVSAPALSASCSASPVSVTTGQSVTWTATASGGTGSYSYSWSGSSPLGGKIGNPVSVTYPTTGTKTGTVTVISGVQIVSQACSTSVSVATAPAVPVAPSSLRVDSASLNTCGTIRLTWTDNANNEDRFELERDSGSGFANIANLSPNATSFTDTNVSQNTSYSYRVRACNAVGCSAYSNAVTGNNRSPSADFTRVPQQPKVNQPVLFMDTSTPFGGATIILRRWTFENGNPATTTSLRATTTTRFVNATPLNKASTLAVTDSLLRACSITKSILVTKDTNGDWCELPPDALPGTPCP